MNTKKISPKAIALIAIGALVLISFAIAFISVGAKSCVQKKSEEEFYQMLADYTEKPFEEITFPTSGIGAMLPVPKSTLGRITQDSSSSFAVTVSDITSKDYEEYVEKCKEAGFTVDYQKTDSHYTAYNESQYYLSVDFNESESTMRIQIQEPRKETEAPTKAPTEKPTEAPTQAPKNDQNTNGNSQQAVDQSLIRDNIKEAIDSYEAFVDEYCDFMSHYDSSDLSMLGRYMELMEKELEMSKKFEALDDEELTDAEALYYSEVSLRCSKKLADAAANMY